MFEQCIICCQREKPNKSSQHCWVVYEWNRVVSASWRFQTSVSPSFWIDKTPKLIFTLTKTLLFDLYTYSVTMISLCWITCYWVLPPRFVWSPLYESQPFGWIALGARGVDSRIRQKYVCLVFMYALGNAFILHRLLLSITQFLNLIFIMWIGD